MSSNFRIAHSIRYACSWLVFTLIIASWCSSVSAYTPESPEVKEMLRKATRFLEEDKAPNTPDGGYWLAAIAISKSGGDANHPVVKLAIDKAMKMVKQVRENGIGKTVYAEAICFYFLADLDGDRYRNEILIILNAMLERQTANGSWGYKPHLYHDTSQTQYGVLCLWAAYHNKLPVPVDAVERAANYLMRTQDPSGGWCYSPTDTGKFERRNWGPVTHSMAAAGLSSLQICASLLGFTAKPQETKADDGLPPALERVETEREKEEKAPFMRPSHTNRQMVESCAMLGKSWFDKNLRYDIDKWTHYYMYALERYKAFEELTTGRSVAEPDWYNKGVEYLRRTQQADGSWKTKESHGSSAFVDTAFAMLFLTRSSQKAIKKAVLDEGILVGGRGLPTNLANAKMVDGKVVTPQMVQDVDDLMSLLTDIDDKPFDATQLPGGLSLEDDIKKRTSQLEKLRELVTNENFDARMAAVKTLATSHELDNVPALLYAVTDPNDQIVREAREGLRLISRKIRGFAPLSNINNEMSKSEKANVKAELARQWKDWYLAIRPDGELLK